MTSLADHIDGGAQVGDRFEITGFDASASQHMLAEVTHHSSLVEGATIQLLDWQEGSYIRRCRFSAGEHIWSGKSHAMRVLCRPVGRNEE